MSEFSSQGIRLSKLKDADVYGGTEKRGKGRGSRTINTFNPNFVQFLRNLPGIEVKEEYDTGEIEIQASSEYKQKFDTGKGGIVIGPEMDLTQINTLIMSAMGSSPEMSEYLFGKYKSPVEDLTNQNRLIFGQNFNQLPGKN